MNILVSKIKFAFKACRELGFLKIFYILFYRLAILLGLYCLITPKHSQHSESNVWSCPEIGPDLNTFPLKLPEKKSLIATLDDEKYKLYAEADEIVNGRIRYFGADPKPLNLMPTENIDLHWSLISDTEKDLKLIWESARLSWVFILGRAFYLSGDERYAEAFWKYLKHFIKNNPLNSGPNWVSSQEIAFRILAMSFGNAVFQNSIHTTDKNSTILLNSIWDHAKRIGPTLIYAKSQNNNHLLSEAVGLYTAGLHFGYTRTGRRWKKVGWKLFHQVLQDQISDDGTYVQHSTNYHRLMLHLSVWMDLISKSEQKTFPDASLQKLKYATKWLLSLTDIISGKVANLGHNDGTNILPLSICDYQDFRPILQAVSCKFLGKRIFKHGAWDELCLWLDIDIDRPMKKIDINSLNPAVLRLGNFNSWGYLRAAQHNDRPAHADQLHVDIWWRGENIAMDPGTYRYTDNGIWQNGLAETNVHNTILIANMNQMTRAGRFLWLDWAQANVMQIIEPNHVSAEHDGYRKLGIKHRRSLNLPNRNTWEIIDDIFSTQHNDCIIPFAVHWLLPDVPFEHSGSSLVLQTKNGNILIRTTSQDEANVDLIFSSQIILGGKLLSGAGDYPKTMGWYSPTYDKKVPALSYRLLFQSTLPIKISTHWILGYKAKDQLT